jgi:hypothetical protein
MKKSDLRCTLHRSHPTPHTVSLPTAQHAWDEEGGKAIAPYIMAKKATAQRRIKKPDRTTPERLGKRNAGVKNEQPPS